MREIVEEGSDINADRGVHPRTAAEAAIRCPPFECAGRYRDAFAPEHFRPPPLPRGTSDAHPSRAAV